ncbi:MAG: hypothetical protein HY868_13885 [Chloroflexi bacterium]|nr:hypothetical protein [Chloroflexota bacterium]
MANKTFDYLSKDAQALPVTPLEPRDFDFARYEDHARAADERYAAFMRQPDGIAVWQRVRVADVFRDGCRDMRASLHWQLGALQKSLDYFTDAPTYLEPWYGIGITASAFGGEYIWLEGQAPAMHGEYKSVDEFVDLTPREFDQAPILRHTLKMIEYFLEETHGRVPMSWSDLQSSLNVATELVDTGSFFTGMLESPDKVREILSAVSDAMIAFTQKQSALIGDALARPGHGFASSRLGTGIGVSCDNLVMVSPRMYDSVCNPFDARIGAAFGGFAIHSCGDWSRWIEAVKKNPQLKMVDGAFSPQTDPGYNDGRVFRDGFVNSGVIVHARMVGDPDDVLARVKEMWAPGLKLIIVTYVDDPLAQRQLYHELHALCA